MYYFVLGVFAAGFLLIYRVDPFALRPGAEGDPRQRVARHLAGLPHRPLQARGLRAVGRPRGPRGRHQGDRVPAGLPHRRALEHVGRGGADDAAGRHGHGVRAGRGRLRDRRDDELPLGPRAPGSRSRRASSSWSACSRSGAASWASWKHGCGLAGRTSQERGELRAAHAGRIPRAGRRRLSGQGRRHARRHPVHLPAIRRARAAPGLGAGGARRRARRHGRRHGTERPGAARSALRRARAGRGPERAQLSPRRRHASPSRSSTARPRCSSPTANSRR